MERGSKVGEGGQTGTAICVNESNMAKGAMDSLNIVKMARMAFEAVKEVSNVVKEFESLEDGEANLPGWDVP